MSPIYQTLVIIFMISTLQAVAQTNAEPLRKHDKIHVVSGMGWGFSAGSIGEVLRPKFSSNLGLDISLKKEPYFLYPSIDFLTFGYNQQEPDPGYPFSLEKSRGNFYVLNLAGGIKKSIGKVNTYGYAGPGIALVSEPRSNVMLSEQRVRIENKRHLSPALRGGVGADYKLGGFYLFVEAGWLHSFRKIQERPVHIISMYGGLKTDVTRIADNVIKVIDSVAP